MEKPGGCFAERRPIWLESAWRRFMGNTANYTTGNYTREALEGLSVDTPDRAAYQKVKENWDGIAKPLDGMGRFEELTAQIGAIQGTEDVDISKKAVIIMCRKASARQGRK